MNMNPPFLAGAIEPVARPLPILHPVDQPSFHRIPVHVVKLLCPLVIAVHIEVVIPRLPESPLVAPPSDGKLQSLETNSQRLLKGFADKQMNMLRHNNILDDFKLKSAEIRSSASSKRSLATGALR
jgi:hypothetical protein